MFSENWEEKIVIFGDKIADFFAIDNHQAKTHKRKKLLLKNNGNIFYIYLKRSEPAETLVEF
jgi:hypothetical protein